MASSISAAVYVDSQVSTNYEPSVFLVPMASSLSAAVYVDSQVSTTYQQPSVSREPSV